MESYSESYGVVREEKSLSIFKGFCDPVVLSSMSLGRSCFLLSNTHLSLIESTPPLLCSYFLLSFPILLVLDSWFAFFRGNKCFCWGRTLVFVVELSWSTKWRVKRSRTWVKGWGSRQQKQGKFSQSLGIKFSYKLQEKKQERNSEFYAVVNIMYLRG